MGITDHEGGTEGGREGGRERKIGGTTINESTSSNTSIFF